MKTFLINPHIPLAKFYGRYARFGAVLPPYGLACIASYMRRQNLAVTLLDANRIQISEEEIIAEAKAQKPDIVGLYATTLGYAEAESLAEAVRRAMPGVKLILGGPHAIGERGDVLRKNPVWDFACAGEGEMLMVQLVAALTSGGDLGAVSGLIWRDGDKIVENAITAVLDPNDVGSPQRELNDLSGYRQKAFAYRRSPFTMMQTVRGCPFKCVFCSSPNYLQSIQGGKLRFHSIEWIENELDYLVNQRGVKEVYFVDDTFNCGAKRVTEICEMIIRRFPGLAWSCNFEVKIASKEMLQLMQRAGCWSIMIGAESGNQDILNLIQKGITVEQIIQVSDWCHEIGLMGRASFILGHPNETPETLEQTLKLAERVRLPFVTFSLMTPFPGTKLFDMANDYGDWNYASEKTTLSKVNFIPFGVNETLLQRSVRSGYRRVYGNLRRNFALLAYLKRPENREFFRVTLKRMLAA